MVWILPLYPRKNSMKQFRSTLILLLIAIILGGYLYFHERGPAAQVGNTVLLRSDPAKVQQVKISRLNSQLILSRNGTAWQVQDSKRSSPADPDSVKTLLDNLQLVQSGAVVAKPGKLSEYGLNGPQNSIAVNDAVINFGDSPSFDRGKVYAQVKDGNSTTIALLPTILRDDALKTFADWRDKAVLRYDDKKVVQLQISAPRLKATFTRKNGTDHTSWDIVAPVPAKADADAIQNFLTILNTAQTNYFLEDNPQDLRKWGLDKPRAMVQISTPEGIKIVKIGKTVTGGYAAQNSFSSSVFVLPMATFSMINRPLSQWRDKSLLSLDTSKVTQMQISAHGQTVTLHLLGTQWVASNPQLNKMLVGNAASDFLVGLQNLRADDFIDNPSTDANYGLDHPALQVQITSSQWQDLKTVQLSVHNDKNYARLLSPGVTSQTVYVMQAHMFDVFSDALKHLFGK